MPFAVNRGQRIDYLVDGSGPLVILQHGLLLDAESWKRAGIVDLLADGYRVACVDSLGHGLSDKPSAPERYRQAQRAADVVAVMDELGTERAHFVGHSMGGWIGVGMARYFAERLASLAIGGWHPSRGLPPGPKGPIGFDAFMNFAKRTTPNLVQWVTSAIEPGVRACFESLSELQGAREALVSVPCPVMMWDGRDDPDHPAKETFAKDNGFPFFLTAGDHLGMLFRHGAETANGIRAFLDEARRA
jgi:pimeloyl-ACP methyl ester carboxylesterase